MKQLNCHASNIVREVGAHALTDVTGFSLLGHGYEMAAASNVCIQFFAPCIPVLPGALDYAYRGITTGGAARNRRYLEGKVSISGGVSEDFAHILFDPQTSGGLLFAVDHGSVDEVEAQFRQQEVPLWRVGKAVAGQGVTVEP